MKAAGYSFIVLCASALVLGVWFLPAPAAAMPFAQGTSDALSGAMPRSTAAAVDSLNVHLESVPIVRRTTQYFKIDGRSMENYNFFDGQVVTVDLHNTAPQKGDVVVFDCLYCNGLQLKKVLNINDNGCYWLEGRRDIWREGDEHRQSMDSRTRYGWLCPNRGEVTFTGVVVAQS